MLRFIRCLRCSRCVRSSRLLQCMLFKILATEENTPLVWSSEPRLDLRATKCRNNAGPPLLQCKRLKHRCENLLPIPFPNLSGENSTFPREIRHPTTGFNCHLPDPHPKKKRARFATTEKPHRSSSICWTTLAMLGFQELGPLYGCDSRMPIALFDPVSCCTLRLRVKHFTKEGNLKHMPKFKLHTSEHLAPTVNDNWLQMSAG